MPAGSVNPPSGAKPMKRRLLLTALPGKGTPVGLVRERRRSRVLSKRTLPGRRSHLERRIQLAVKLVWKSSRLSPFRSILWRKTG